MTAPIPIVIFPIQWHFMNIPFSIGGQTGVINFGANTNKKPIIAEIYPTIFFLLILIILSTYLY